MSNLHYELLITKAYWVQKEKDKLKENESRNRTPHRQYARIVEERFIRQEKYYKTKIMDKLVLLTRKKHHPIVQQMIEKEIDTWTVRLDHLYSSNELLM